MKRLLSILFMATAMLSTQAQEKITFKLSPDFNKPIKYEMINKMDVEGPQTMIMDMVMQMDMKYSNFQDSLLSVSAKYSKVKVDLDAGIMTAAYDSSKEPTNEIEKAFATQFKPLVENTLTYTINQFGSVKTIDFPNVSEQIFDKSIIKNLGLEFPNYAVTYGDSWTSQISIVKAGLKSQSKYTLVEKNDLGYKIDFDISINDESGVSVGFSKGHFIIHPNTYVTISSSSTTTIEMQGAKIQTTSELKEVK